MAIPVKRMLRTRGALVAAITTIAVGLTLVATSALTALVGQLGVGGALSVGFADPRPEMMGAGAVPTALATILPFTLGYFLALWLIAPITEQLGIGHVITRSILATGVGATLWFVALGLAGVALAISATGQGILGAEVPLLIGVQLGYALQSALVALIVTLPLGVLGGVLQWVWRTSHPAEHHIEGIIDV